MPRKSFVMKKNEDGKEYSIAVFLDYISKRSTNNTFFMPAYFKEELNISDGKAFLSGLIKEGYLEKDNDEKVILTSKGEAFLFDKNDYVRFFNFATPYASISEYEKIKAGMKEGNSFEGIMITLFLNKIRKLKKQDDYVGVKNLHLDVGTLYEDLGYKPQSMYHYLVSLYLEVSGLEYYDAFLKYIKGQSSARDLESSYEYTYIAPHITSAIKRLKDSYIDEMVDSVYEKNYININLCKKEKFRELVADIIDDKFVNKDWQVYFKEAFKRLISVANKYK